MNNQMDKKNKLSEMKAALSNLTTERDKADKSYSAKISHTKSQIKILDAEIITEEAISFLLDKTNYWIGNKILDVKSSGIMNDKSDLIIITGTPIIAENSGTQYTVCSAICISNNYGSSTSLTISVDDNFYIKGLKSGYQNVSKEEFMLKYAEWDKIHKDNLFKEISKVPELLSNNILGLIQ
jgi:hypothetical protein